MYRPNEIEEQRILELAQWIEKAKEDSTYSSYVIGKISGHIKLAWEHFRYRHELCSSDFETTKQNLLNKYSEEGRFSELVKQKIQEIKKTISADIYDYFIKFAEEKVGLYLAHIKYRKALMVESGWLPNMKGVLDLDIENEAEDVMMAAQKVNELYLELTDWIETLTPNDTIDEKGIKSIKSVLNKSLHISKLYYARNKETPLEYVKETILKENSIEQRNRFPFINVLKDIDLSLLNQSGRPQKKTREERREIREANKTNFYPNQEKFYSALENWAKSLNNPYCRDFIVRYLRNGRQMPFYKIRVFKYIKEPEKAKEFLLEQYEMKLEKEFKYEHERIRKSDKHWDKRYKSDLRFYKKALKESGSVDFTDNDEQNRRSSSNKVTDYLSGYAGTWVHDEAGWSDDDIDTVLDGDPDAYWNID